MTTATLARSRTDLTFAWETVRAAAEDRRGFELLQAHYEEVAADADVIPVDPDWDYYLEQERLGRFKTFVARRGGVVIGYVAFFIGPHRQSRSTKVAFADLLYLTPDERRGRLGQRLIEGAEPQLREWGCKRIVHTIPVEGGPDPERVERMYRRMGYRPYERLVQKLL